MNVRLRADTLDSGKVPDLLPCACLDICGLEAGEERDEGRQRRRRREQTSRCERAVQCAGTARAAAITMMAFCLSSRRCHRTIVRAVAGKMEKGKRGL